jgi:hypothetical protein
VGYSASPSGERALAYAGGMALRAGTALIVVHVSHPMPSPSWWEGSEPMIPLDLPDDSSERLAATL